MAKRRVAICPFIPRTRCAVPGTDTESDGISVCSKPQCTTDRIEQVLIPIALSLAMSRTDPGSRATRDIFITVQKKSKVAYLPPTLLPDARN